MPVRSQRRVCPTHVFLWGGLSSVVARGRLLVISRVGLERKFLMPPVGLQLPASLKMLLHTLPAVLLLALKQPQQPLPFARAKVRGPRRDTPIAIGCNS